jgi:CDP-diacylglycerol---glycerol-3-phosphate 3-phosphatidyltransferase
MLNSNKKIFQVANVPNILTLLRILLIPAFIIVYYLPWHLGNLVASIIFILAALTDWLDGYLARNLNQISSLGAFLDPVADKLIIAVALVLIVGQFGTIYITIPAAIIIMREIIISALREWMAELGKRASVAVGFIGKIKTFAQMFALILLLIYEPGMHGGLLLKIFGMLFLYVAVCLTIWSMFMYLKIAWPDLTIGKEKS